MISLKEHLRDRIQAGFTVNNTQSNKINEAPIDLAESVGAFLYLDK